MHVHVKARSHEAPQRLRLRQRFFNVMHTGIPLALKNLEIRGNEKSFSRQGKVGEFEDFTRKSGKIISENKNTLI